MERFAQGGFEAADGDDGAAVGFEFEALDEFEIWFAGTDDVSEADLRGWRGEGDAARAAAGGGDEMVGGEGLDHVHLYLRVMGRKASALVARLAHAGEEEAFLE